MNITNSINILELINKTYEFKNKITELIEQIKLETILYKGSLLLSNGMTRFMVIGK